MTPKKAIVSPLKNPPLAILQWCMRRKVLASFILILIFLSSVGATIGNSDGFSIIELVWNFALIFFVFIFVVFLVLIYLAPYFVAKDRNKSNTTAILALNILLGWTLIGWTVALVWALTKENQN